jgi:mannose-6-phosphate isomerase
MNFTKNKESFTVYMCVEGSFELILQNEKYNYSIGDTILIPAAMSEFKIKGVASLLEIYIS